MKPYSLRELSVLGNLVDIPSSLLCMLSAVLWGQTDGLVCISLFFTQALSEFPFCVHFVGVTEAGVVVTVKTSFSWTKGLRMFWATINVRSILGPLANQLVVP